MHPRGTALSTSSLLHLHDTSAHARTSNFKYQFVHKIAECVGWKKLWDHALDHGPSVIKGMKNLVRVITYPDHLPNKCPLCDAAVLDKPTLAEHVITNHTKSDNSWCTLLDSLTAMDPTFFSHVLCLLHVF